MSAGSERSARLERDTSLIADRLLRLAPGTEAVFLSGGYGRGEGAWIAAEGEVRPYNDYDMTLVVDRPPPADELESVRSELARATGVRWVDVSTVRRRSLPWLRRSVYNYDLAHGSRLIRGDPAVEGEIRRFPASEIPMREILVLFLTRLWTFLGSLEAGEPEALEGESARFFRSQMAKATLSVADVLLLERGRYDASYRQRVDRTLALGVLSDREGQRLQWGLEQKLEPSPAAMSAAEVRVLFEEVRQMFWRRMTAGLSVFLGREVSTPAEVVRAYRWHPGTVLRRVVNPVLRGGRGHSSMLAVEAAQVHLVGGYTGSWSVESESLASAARELDKAGYASAPDAGFNELREMAARARMEI